MVQFLSTLYVGTFGAFNVNRAITTLIHLSSMGAWLRDGGSGSGPGGILGLSVHGGFLGSTDSKIS